MAFNWQTFRTRTLTAAIFVVVMLTGLLWNYWSFFILFSIIHFGCWWEYLNLVEKINNTKFNTAIRMLLMIAGYILFLNIGIRSIHFDFLIGKGRMMISLKWVFFISLVGLLLIYLFQNHTISFKAKWMTLAGFAYISLSTGLMIALNNYSIKIYYSNYLPPFPYAGFFPSGSEYKWSIPILIIGVVWINDTMAYLIGSLIGKTPLSMISPKKTWEGTIGGIILAVGVAVLVAWLADFNIADIVITTLIIVITGTLGDLFESRLKRMANVKDSGTLMPGHGGFLDRFDSLLLATPAVWLLLFFLDR